jgi:hypothetical protein
MQGARRKISRLQGNCKREFLEERNGSSGEADRRALGKAAEFRTPPP